MTATTVEEAVMELDHAFNLRDMDAVLSFYENDAVVVMAPGRMARGKDELRQFFAQLFAMKCEAHQMRTHVIETGDIALFISKWQLVGESSDGRDFSREGIATSIFRKGADSKWRIVIDNCFGPASLESVSS